MKRTTAREEAVKLVYQADLQNDSYSDVLELYKQLNDVSDSGISFIEGIVTGVQDNIERIDSIISESLKNWTIDRLAKIVCAALRVAVYEMEFCDDVPTGVAVNEAVNFVKCYADDESANFTNGILGTISRRNNAE